MASAVDPDCDPPPSEEALQRAQAYLNEHAAQLEALVAVADRPSFAMPELDFENPEPWGRAVKDNVALLVMASAMAFRNGEGADAFRYSCAAIRISLAVGSAPNSLMAHMYGGAGCRASLPLLEQCLQLDLNAEQLVIAQSALGESGCLREGARRAICGEYLAGVRVLLSGEEFGCGSMAAWRFKPQRTRNAFLRFHRKCLKSLDISLEDP